MRNFSLSPVLVAIVFGSLASPGAAGSTLEEESGIGSITAEELSAHVTHLASDEFEGRAAGTEGGHRAAIYIAREFASYGLEAIDAGKNFLQPFDAAGKATENVVGFLQGSHPERSKEFIVIGAHYDHLGKDAGTGAIYHGADDDASGTAVMMELAEAFGRSKTRPERSLIFIAFGAEEMGLIGSRYYAENALRPIEQTRWMVNLEMMGRGDEGMVTVMMLSELPDSLLDVIGEQSLEMGLEPVDGGQAHIRSGDQASFLDAGVPILCFYGGENHPDYHQPSDTADKIQPQWMQSVARLVYRSVAACANDLP